MAEALLESAKVTSKGQVTIPSDVRKQLGIPSGGNGFRRTTAFREFQRMKDGRIPKINIEVE